MSIEEARSFQAASKSLDQVLDDFNELHFDQEYDALEQVATNHAQEILLNLDKAFQALHLYWPPQSIFDSQPSFGSWTAGSLPSASVYHQETADKMAVYLADEQQEVEKFAAATQIVATYLNQHVLRKAELPPAVARWQEISNDLKRYDAAAPSTGLGALDQFLSSSMDKTAPPDCQLPAAQVNSSRLYFVQVRHALEQELVSRCQSLSKTSATVEYARLDSNFKLPFCALPASDPKFGADPDDIIKLFGLLDQDESSIREGLHNASKSSDLSKAKIKAFLLQLDGLRPVFASLLSGQPGALPAFDLVPAFRVNRGYEFQGNQVAEWKFTIGDYKNRIAEWTMSTGDGTPRASGATTPGHWTYRDPVSVTLRWAKNSTLVPASTPLASVDQKSGTVIYRFSGPWSLLRMLVQMAPPDSDFERRVDPDPQTMLFTVNQENAQPTVAGASSKALKTTSASQAEIQPVKVFARIRISAPAKTEALRLPVFPTQAPTESGGK